MPLDKNVLLARINDLLALKLPAGDTAGIYSIVAEAMQGTVTVARAVYGDATETPQVHTIMKAAQHARETKEVIAAAFLRTVWPVVQGSLRAMKADVESGLVGTIERRATGEIIADMLALAKEALEHGSDGAKDVAAVLTAAAYEDTIRKMGAALAGVAGRPDLSDVIGALKSAGIITGAPLSIALSYLKFRNDALHADWARLDAAAVASCISFVERLVLQHFS
jgi:hypothetical protein